MLFANKIRRGFTLIELMVVITISGLLLGIVTIGTVNSKKNSRDAQRIKDIQVIASALESYAANNQGIYPKPPASASSLSAVGVSLLTEEKFVSFLPNKTIPTDPKPVMPGSTGEYSGYIYYSHYYANQKVAIVNSVYYSLGVALENKLSPDDSTNFLDFPFPSTRSTAYGIRYFQIFNGPSCQPVTNDNPPECY